MGLLGGGAGAFGGAHDGSMGGSTASVGAECASPRALFDNWNSEACSSLTDTGTFTLTASAFVTSLDFWINTAVAGLKLQYALVGPGGGALSSGILDKGSCDPTQNAWCQVSARLNQALGAGTYSIVLSAQNICSNPASSNLGFVRVMGCAAGTTDAGVPVTADAGTIRDTGIKTDLSTGTPDAGTIRDTRAADSYLVVTPDAGTIRDTTGLKVDTPPMTPDAGIARDTGGTGGYVGTCVMELQCVEYTSAPANQYGPLESQCASLYSGTWRTSPGCSGTWCGTCTLTVPGQISYVAYYTICGADLTTQCQAIGGVFAAQ